MMSKKIEECIVFIASPGDVIVERQIIREVCFCLNHGMQENNYNIQLKAVGWEDIIPKAGRPQEILNQIIECCEIFVCIFNKRFGSPTGIEESGTIEELLHAYDIWKSQKTPHIILYFKDAKINPTADQKDEQLMRVIKFKNEIDKNKILRYDIFSDVNEFKVKFKKNMNEWIRNNLFSLKSSPHSSKIFFTNEELIDKIIFNYKQFAIDKHPHPPMKGFETDLKVWARNDEVALYTGDENEEQRQEKGHKQELKLECNIKGPQPIEKVKVNYSAIIKIDKNNSEMVLVPEGNFIYGSGEDDKLALNWEKPQQFVYLPSFFIDIYPVTNRQYCMFLNEKKPEEKELRKWIDLLTTYNEEKCRIIKERINYIVEPGYEDYPVVYISWYGAVAYANWVGKRLPLETEWEKAARGTDGRTYPWGDNFSKRFCNSAESGISHIAPVTAYSEGKSPYGCYGMAGNVWEWCNDCFDENNYKTNPGCSLRMSEIDYNSVIRGGSWINVARYLRCANRGRYELSNRNFNLGFRLCQNCT